MAINFNYPVRYSDRQGTEEAVMTNDGENLSFKVRGVEFSGESLNDFEPSKPFFIHPEFNTLCDCTLEMDMPVTVVKDKVPLPDAILKVTLELGMPLEDGSLDKQALSGELVFGGQVIHSGPDHYHFQDMLSAIQKQLPKTCYLKCCFSCAYSGYHPVGQALFGALLCFRSNKADYLQVRDKTALFKLWQQLPEKLMVQETHLCLEFENKKIAQNLSKE